MHICMCIFMYVLYVYSLDINFILIKIFLIGFLKKFFFSVLPFSSGFPITVWFLYFSFIPHCFVFTVFEVNLLL